MGGSSSKPKKKAQTKKKATPDDPLPSAGLSQQPSYTKSTRVDTKKTDDVTNKPPSTSTTSYKTYEPPSKSTALQPNNDGMESKFEYDMKEILVTGYIRLVIFILLGNDDESDDEEEESIMNIIPFDVIKLCEQYYEANMIMFMIQSCYDQALLNGVECINLNCKKVIKLRTVAMDNTDKIVSLDQHWFDKTVYTYYLPNITIPSQAYSSYGDILAPIQQPSIILKCNLNSWREEHKASMIIFDNRLLHNWNFTNTKIKPKHNASMNLITDLDANTKEIDAYEMSLPILTAGSVHRPKSQLRQFVYSADHGLLAMSVDTDYNGKRCEIHKLKFASSDASDDVTDETKEKEKEQPAEDTKDTDDEKKSSDDDKDEGWRWVKLKSAYRNNNEGIAGMCVVESPSLEYGKHEQLFILKKKSEGMFRDAKNNRLKSIEYEIGYYDVINEKYKGLSTFRANGKSSAGGYWYNHSPLVPDTDHKGNLWIQPSLHYNQQHKKVFLGGDDTNCIEGYDIIKDKWLYLPKTKYIHLRGCTVWSLPDQSNDILYIDQGKNTSKLDNMIELFDLRDNAQKWRLSDHYMQWKDFSNKEEEQRYDYHIYRRSFI